MSSILKKFKKREYLTEEEVENIQLNLLLLKDEAEKICRNKNISKQDFNRLCEIGKTIAVYKKQLKVSLKYANGGK